MNIFQKICLLITIIGAINWGLIGIFDFNLVTYITQNHTIANSIIYSVIGLAGLLNIMLLGLKMDRHDL